MDARCSLVVCLIVVSALVASAGSDASASTLTYTDSVPSASTNWSHTVTLPKFNPALGTLTSVNLTLTGTVTGSAAFENQDPSPQVEKMNLSATVSLLKPDCSTLVVTLPFVAMTDCASAYDGILDFGGTSGKTYGNLSNADTESSLLTLAADMNPFQGSGSIVLPITAAGTSSGSGGGNEIFHFTSLASASVQVDYDYNAVPEPATMTLFAVGLVGWGVRSLSRGERAGRRANGCRTNRKGGQI